MEKESQKPTLSFGISSILGVSNLHKHLKTSHNNERTPKSAFRLTKGQQNRAEVIEKQHDKYNDSTAHIPALRDKVPLAEYTSTSTLVPRKDYDTSPSTSYSSFKPIANTSTALGIDFANIFAAAASRSSKDMHVNHHSQQVPSTATSGLSTTGAPFLPLGSQQLSTNNYLLKSLDTFRPKSYGESSQICIIFFRLACCDEFILRCK